MRTGITSRRRDRDSETGSQPGLGPVGGPGRMRRLAAGLFLPLALSAASAAVPLEEKPVPVPLTIEEAVRTVLEHNPSLQEAEHAVAVFEARVEEQKSALWPQVFGDLNYARLGPIQELSFPGFGTFQLNPANNYDAHASLHQLLFDGNQTREAVRLARSQVASASDRWEVLRHELEFQTARLFETLIFLRDSIRVQSDHIQTLEDHLGAARKKVEAGTATELEVLNTQVRIVSARNTLIDLRNASDKQVLLLRQLMGLEEGGPLELQGSFSYRPAGVEPEALVRSAWERRPEMKAVRDMIRTADIQVRLAGLANWPTLSLTILGGLKNGYVPNLNTLKLNYVAAVQATVPVFNGFRTRSLKAEAEANRRTLDDRDREVKDLIRREVLQALADLDASREKLQSVEVNVERARTALDYARLSYEAGTITNLDLLDTEDAYSEAELVRLQALYQFVVSRLALQRAVGNRFSD
jgi:outer membrane protein